MTSRLAEPRPRPLLAAADAVVRGVGLLVTVVGMLVGWGVLTLAQGDAISGLLGLIPGLVTAVAVLLTALGVVRAAEPHVTPLSDPRDAQLRPLVPRG